MTVWIAHGENDEVFPASDVRMVAEMLREAGANVRLDIFPGRGHGFGDDQPLLVKAAAEFCARELEAKAIVPVNVRPALWYFWIPAGLFGGVLLLQRLRLRTGTPHPAFGHPLPIGWVEGRGEGQVGNRNQSARWLKVGASVALMAATLVSAAHLALPLFRASPAPLKLARHWCVRSDLRADFDWLVLQPGANSCRIRDLLEHLNLAYLQRGQFATSLPENEWREYVLSPRIEGAGEDIAGRRELWEWMSPRVRRETDAEQAAAQVARQLRLCVSPDVRFHSQSVSQSWRVGRADRRGMCSLQVAALRATGLTARLASNDLTEVQVDGQWRTLPKPEISLEPP